MSKWVRVDIALDLKVNKGETFAGILRDLMDGMSQGEPDQSRLIQVRAHEVEDYDKHSCETEDYR